MRDRIAPVIAKEVMFMRFCIGSSPHIQMYEHNEAGTPNHKLLLMKKHTLVETYDHLELLTLFELNNLCNSFIIRDLDILY